jgi:hypothetical protein
VSGVLAATAAELAELKALWRSFLVLRRHIIPTFAGCALKHYIITCHKSPLIYK